jgi:hypothetical protein
MAAASAVSSQSGTTVMFSCFSVTELSRVHDFAGGVLK